MNWLPTFKYTRVIIFLTIITLAISITITHAAYRINRPVASSDEPINQSYLYGEGAAVHKGIDWSAADLGDSVYAVADGTVVNIQETRPNNCHPAPAPPPNCPAWGNFVLLRQDTRHYDAVSGQMSYMYSLYLHLQNNSVFVIEGEHVNTGTLIAQVDNTGNSSGDHLHFQIVIHPQSDRRIEPTNTLESETRSRNPELWLNPYLNTATAVGKVTDLNGNPVTDLRIHGLQKQAGWGYGWSETYSDVALNSDDIFFENFGTTDIAISPGTYHVEAKYTNGALYEDLGWHTFTAGRVTYLGLYPTALPDVRSHGLSSDWQSTIWNYNPSSTKTSQVKTTFFSFSGWVPDQQSDTVTPQSTAFIDHTAAYNSGTGLVVPSTYAATTIANYRATNGQAFSYNGLLASDALNPGWGQVGTLLHLPLLMDNNSGWSTRVTVFNPGPAKATFNFDCFGQGTDSGSWSVASQATLEPYNAQNYYQLYSVCPTIGAGRITSDQPLAVTVLQEASGVSMGYTGFSAGATTVNLPLIMANNSGWVTGIAVQNLGAANTTVQVQYYPLPGYPSRNPENLTVAPNRTGIFLQAGGQWGSTPWIGSARVTAGQEIAAIVNQNVTGRGMSYNSFLNGSSLIILPDVRNNAAGWLSGVQVQNIDSSTANVVLRVNGSQTWSGSIAGYRSITLLPVPGTGSGFQGGATVESTNGRRIVAIVNQTQNSSSDRAMSYNGINR